MSALEQLTSQPFSSSPVPGGALANLTSSPPPAPNTGSALSSLTAAPFTPPAPHPAPAPTAPGYFQSTLPDKTFVGISDQKDVSGKPYFAYRLPGAQATTTDTTRVATTFDPTKAQKLDPSVVQNGRMPESMSAPIKKALGGNYSDELDHSIALELSGSNNPTNLRVEPGRATLGSSAGESAGFDTEENQLARQVATGQMSLWAAQYKLASDKASAGDKNPLPFVDTTAPAAVQQKQGLLASIIHAPDNSVMGEIKNTILGIPKAAVTSAQAVVGGIRGIGDSIIQQYATPSPLEQSMEANMRVPGPVKAVNQAVLRTIEPMVEPFVTDATSAIIFNQPQLYNAFVHHLATSGANDSGQAIIQAAQKTPVQVVGDTAQAVLGAYAPDVLGSSLEAFAKKGIVAGITTSVVHGVTAGITFGAAQAASSGSTDPHEIAGIIFKNAVAGGMISLVSAGVTHGVAAGAPAAVNAIKARLPKTLAEAQRGFAYIPGLGDLPDESAPNSKPEEPEQPEGAKTPYDTPAIIAERARQEALPKTIDIQTPERDALRKKITDESYGTGAVNKNKRLDIVTGPPAAGKSSNVAEPLAKEHGSLLADSDTVKEKLPEFEGGRNAMAVHHESAAINKDVLMRALENGDNIVYPTVGEDLGRLNRFIGAAKDKGYDVHLHNVSLPPEKSLPRIITRFNETGRFVDPDYAYNKVGLRPDEVHDILHSDERLTSATQYSTDVAKGDKPILLRRRGEVRGQAPDTQPRLDESGDRPESARVHGRAGDRGDGAKQTPLRSRAELENELQDVKGYLSYIDDAYANHPAKGLLQYYGGRSPHTITLDDILARNVEKKTGAKSAHLDSIVTEHGYPTPTEAHEGVLQYLQLRDQHAQLHELSGKLQKELSQVKAREEATAADNRASDRASRAGEKKRQAAQAAHERAQTLATVKEQAVPGYTREVRTDSQGRERLTPDPLANPSNFYQRMTEMQKADPDRSLNEMHHISREDIQGAIERTKAREEALHAKRQAIEKSRSELPYSLSTWKKIKAAMHPIANLPEEVRAIATSWRRGELTAVEKANQEYTELPGAQTKIAADGTRTLVKKSPLDVKMPPDVAVKEYTAIQHGKYSPVRDVFDRLFNYAERSGLDVPYRKNYLPQVYKESLGEIKASVVQYLRDQGVDEDVADGYVQGVMQLPTDVSLHLKVHPFFDETKAFPTYGVAAKYGLHPRFTNMADLVANYRYELEKTLNNKTFTTNLIDKGKLLPGDLAPEHWQHVTQNFVKGDLYAPPELAKMLNDLYRDQASMGIFDTAVHYLGLVSRKAQEISLSGAIPYTNIHFFSMGQLIKEMTAGNFKAIAPFIRANNLGATEHWFRDNQMYAEMMARQGLDISSRMGSIKEIYNASLHDHTWYDKVGIEFRRAFLDKSFGTFLPSLYLQTFKDTYHAALGHGMDEATAEKFAGEVTQKNFGLLSNEARAQATKDTLSGTFFAPQFRESVFGVLGNAAKSITTEWNNPAFYRNRRLVAGMAFSFGMYQVFNKMLNGQYTWENPNGHEFELRIPLQDGNNMYVPFMPSFLAVPRAAATGVLAVAKADPATATQQFGNFFALPLQVAAQVLANKDYFGRAIYGATDTGVQRLEKIGAYLGLAVSHPYVKAVADMITKKQPIYQTLSEATTLPLKFQNNSSIDKGAFYNALSDVQTKNAQSKGDISGIYNQVQQLAAAGQKDQAQQMVDALSDEQYKQYATYKRAQAAKNTQSEKAAQFGDYKNIQQLIKDGKTDEAQQKIDAMTDEQYRIYTLLKKQFGDATNPQ